MFTPHNIDLSSPRSVAEQGRIEPRIINFLDIEMVLKKQERKDKLSEIYYLLAQIKDNDIAAEARKKVIDMLSHDGVFIFEKGE